MLKQPHAEFRRQHPQHRPIQQTYVCPAVCEQHPQLFPVSGGAGHFYIHPRLQCQQPGLRYRLADVLHRMAVPDAAVVADAESVEAHLLPQQSRQQLLRHGSWFTVNRAVAGHDPPQPGLNGGLEGLAVDLPQQPFRCVAVGPVDAALGVVESQEVLGHALRRSAVNASILHPSGVGRAHGGG